jgi:hypothetical protein
MHGLGVTTRTVDVRINREDLEAILDLYTVDTKLKNT